MLYEKHKSTLSLTPQGMIPEFNALGNHPSDLEKFILENVYDAYVRLGITEKFKHDSRVLINAVKVLMKKPTDQFVGRHMTTTALKKVTRLLIDTFTNIDDCHFFGEENYAKAISLMKQGHNVLVIQNHTSALDALIAEAVVQRSFGSNLPISYIISQVFEYARVTAIITSGIDKFPVFQPKHLAFMKTKGHANAVTDMVKQNIVALRALGKHTCHGGKIIFLYPEKDRNTAMGEPEPIVMKIPELLQITSPKPLYILPTYVTGLESILPHVQGANEIDNLFKNIRVGQGDMYCGKPIEFSKIQQVLQNINQDVLVASTLGKTVPHGKSLYLSALSVLMVGIIANTGPASLSKGIYDNNAVDEAVAKCYA